MRLNIAITSTSAGGALAAALAFASARARSRSAELPRLMMDGRSVGRDDVELGQVLVQFGVDDGDVAHRRLVQLLQDLELDAPVGLHAVQRLGKRVDDRRRRERIRVRAEVRAAEQIAQPAVQCLQFVVREVLDDPRDVADEHRLVHRRRLDEGQVLRIRLGKVDLFVGLARKTVVDRTPQLLFELGHQRRTLAFQRVPGIEKELLLLAHVGLVGAVHQQFADAVHHLRERDREARNREIPAIAQDLRGLARHRAGPGWLGLGRCAHFMDLACRIA